jgi:Flp pilus assembly protein TadD
VSYEHSVYHLVSLGIPEAIRVPAMIAVGVSYCVALLAAAVLLLRGGGARDLVPAAAVVASQALWFSIPVLARYAGLFQTSGPLSAEFAAYAFVWIGIAHSVQYLWVTSYFALRTDRSRQSPGVPGVSRFLFGYGGKVVAAGALLWVLPALLFAPGALGNLPFDAGLAVMITAAINVHHFILDGAIWKLRDGRIARILIRDASHSESPDAAFRVGGTQRPRRWAGPLIWSLGACCVAIFAFGVLELEIGARGALSREDVARAETAADRLAWIGRDSPALRANIGLLAARSGNLERGIEQLQRSLRLFETKEGLVGLASLYSRSGRQLDATALYRRALEIEPDAPEILNNLAWILAVYDTGGPGRADESIELARRASEQLGHRSAVALDTLAVAHAAAGHFEKAHQIGHRALALARKDGEQELADEIAERLARYRARRPFRP